MEMFIVEFRTRRHATLYRTVISATGTKQAVVSACEANGFSFDMDKWQFWIEGSKTMDGKKAMLDLEFVGRVGR